MGCIGSHLVFFNRRPVASEFTGVTERIVRKWLGGRMPTGPKFWGIVQLVRTVPGGLELIVRDEAGSDGEFTD